MKRIRHLRVLGATIAVAAALTAAMLAGQDLLPALLAFGARLLGHDPSTRPPLERVEIS
jgi:hypothetical protein